MSRASTPASPLLARNRLSTFCRFSLVSDCISSADGSVCVGVFLFRWFHDAGRRFPRWQEHARLHRSLRWPAPLAWASDAIPLTSSCPLTFLLVWPFAFGLFP